MRDTYSIAKPGSIRQIVDFDRSALFESFQEWWMMCFFFLALDLEKKNISDADDSFLAALVP